jgi:hypothetical protein
MACNDPNPRPSIVIVPDCARFDMAFLNGGRTEVMSQWFQLDGGWDGDIVKDVVEDFSRGWFLHMMPLTAHDTFELLTYGESWDAVVHWQYVQPELRYGIHSGLAAPSSQALMVNHWSLERGRHQHGFSRVVGLPAPEIIDGGRVSADYANAVRTGWALMVGEATFRHDVHPVTVSWCLNNHWRTLAGVTPILYHTCDGFVRSIRGRGR